jgi:hypothetical protein
MTATAHPELEGLGRYRFGWADSDAAGESARRGLSEAVVRDISGKKDEPGWMLELRLKGLKLFGRKPMPGWGSDLSGIDFDHIKDLRGIHLTGLSQVSGSPGPGCLWALDAWRAASLARRCGWLRLGLGVGDQVPVAHRVVADGEF